MGDDMNKTKLKILHIALKLFKNSSYDEVTINDICKKAGVSKHTFYYYYDSKEDLIKNSVSNFSDHMNSILQEIALIDNPLDKYMAFTLRRVNALFDLGPDICRRLLQLDFESSPNCENEEEDEMRKQFKIILDMRVTFLKNAQQQGLVKNMTDPERLAYFHSSMVYGIIQRWAVTNNKIDLKNSIEEASKSLLNYQ